MIVRKPTLDDIAAVYDCVIPYAAEARQAREVPVDTHIVHESLINVLCAENFEIRVVEDENRIIALAFGYFAQSWWEAPDCAIDMFYVGKECRGTPAARMLVEAMVEAFKTRGCGWMYAAAETDVSKTNTKLYENLFKKFGFRDIGGGRMILNLRGM